MHPPFVPYPFTAAHHAAVLPALINGADPQRHPVVVVGGGPVGYTAALGLVRQGVPVVVLEADDSVCVGSRAICISRRSLEIFQRLGALEGFLKIGLPWTGGRSFYRDTEVLHFKMPQDENQQLPPMLNLAQYSIEQILLDALLAANAAQPGLVEIRWQNKLKSVDPHADGARLQVTTPLGDYALYADWVVAADGGRSTVREQLGLALHGNTYEGRYVIVDILMKSARPTERLAYFDPPCNPGSTVLVHKQPNDVWRIDYQLQEGEDPEAAIRPENVLPRVESLLAMMGETAPWNPIWMGLYKANALTLAHYRHGRVLLAGDAAHLLPIFGVRGANSGIDDADNLAWKLAYVVRGWAGEKLLDSYSQERVPAARENIHHGSKSTEFMAPPSFAFELMRKAVLGLAAAHPAVRSLINPRQSSAITYSHSPLNVGLAAAAACAVPHRAGPVPGAVLPECPLTLQGHGSALRAGHLTELLQPCFVVMAFVDGVGNEAAASELLCELVDLAAQRLLSLRLLLLSRQVPAWQSATVLPAPITVAQAWDHTGRLFPMYGAAPGTLIVVRPDGHVLGCWHDAAAGQDAKRIAQAVFAAIDCALSR
jgi:3-(3-hydroxy-phenyl)propionate hydroxylase